MMNAIKIIIVRLLLFLYLTSSYLSATHVHNDALEQHKDCKVCIVVKNLNSGDVPTAQLNNFDCDYYYEPILSENYQTAYTPLKGFNANAPPLFF